MAVVAVALVLIVFVVIPLLLFGLELVVVGAALAVSIIGRMLLGRPWIVEAERIGPRREVLAWSLSGWRRTERAIDEIAQALATGSPPNPDGATKRG